MPAAPAAPPGGGGGAAKTMFGYAAPVLKPGQPGAPPPRPPGPPAPGGPPPPHTPPPQFGQPPQQPGFPPQFGQPPQQPGFPPQQPPQQFGQPQPGQFPGAPPQQPGFPPPQQPGYPPQQGMPPQQPGFPPPQQPGFPPPQQPGYPPQQGMPPQQPGYPPPQQPGYPPQQPMGMPPQQPGYPPQQPMGMPPQQPGYPPQQPGYPPQQPMGANPFAPPQQDLPGPVDDFARRLPQSKPGTIFGFPVARFRDPKLQQMALMILGAALIVGIFIPYSLGEGRRPMMFSWSKGLSFFKLFLYPLIAGVAYLLVSVAPPNIKKNVPPIVLQWLPFGISLLGIGIVLSYQPGVSTEGYIYLYYLGLATSLFGFLSRIQNPNDQTARIIIAVGSGMLLYPWINTLGDIFDFSPFFGWITNLLLFLVLTLGVLSAVYVVKPEKLPPALKAVDALAPFIAAVLLVWPIVFPLLVFLTIVIHEDHVPFMDALLILVLHPILNIASFFGVLLMTAPAAYEEVMAMMNKNKAGGGGAQPPQQQPPQQPPMGGGYPPQGGGYPPQGGGYPPQQGGGGWPQQ